MINNLDNNTTQRIAEFLTPHERVVLMRQNRNLRDKVSQVHHNLVVETGKPHEKIALFESPIELNLSDELSNKLVNNLANEEPYIKLRLAKSTRNLPENIIRQLANYRGFAVRASIAKRQQDLPQDVITQLENDRSIRVRMAMQSRGTNNDA